MNRAAEAAARVQRLGELLGFFQHTPINGIPLLPIYMFTWARCLAQVRVHHAILGTGCRHLYRKHRGSAYRIRLHRARLPPTLVVLEA